MSKTFKSKHKNNTSGYKHWPSDENITADGGQHWQQDPSKRHTMTAPVDFEMISEILCGLEIISKQIEDLNQNVLNNKESKREE